MEDYVLVAREEGGETCEVDLEPNGSLGLGHSTVYVRECVLSEVPQSHYRDGENCKNCRQSDSPTEGRMGRYGLLCGNVYRCCASKR